MPAHPPIPDPTAVVTSHPTVPDPAGIEQFTNPGLFFGRVVVPVPDENVAPKKGKIGFEYRERCFIGDAIKLKLADGQTVAASGHKFKLSNGLELTYGQINALAGDFYGTWNPISDGDTDEDRSDRFIAAYNTLANPSLRQPKEAESIIQVLQAEVDAINTGLSYGQDPSVTYSTLPDVDVKLEILTFGRRRDRLPDYVQLASINWDHFGEDARTAYNAGHATAIQRAIGGDLEGAYALNAFADHFLEDLFSSGHLRTPRRLLHKPSNLAADWCAKLMHDEDNAVGLQVSDPAGESWKCYGDKLALDKANEPNLKRCVAAVQASADEIYVTYSTKKAPSPSVYAAWEIAPTLESARSPEQELAELFTSGMKRRQDITQRRVRKFTDEWEYVTTYVACKTSGYWNYPITISGVRVAIPWSSVSVVSAGWWKIRVFYQAPGGAIVQSRYWNTNKWFHAHDHPIANAVPFTPLASISWKNGEEVRVYYLDHEYILQECCYSEGRGWSAGDIGRMSIRTSTISQISAIRYGDDMDNNIHVYYQEEKSRAIRELNNDGYWRQGTLHLQDALDGTGIAAVAYKLRNQIEIRVYYQAEDLSLREHCNYGSGWRPGEWNPGKVPGRSPINAMSFMLYNDITEIQVYWRNLQDEVVLSKYTGSWGDAVKVVQGITSSLRFSLMGLNRGEPRVYYQSGEGLICEHCSNNSGQTWFPGWKMKVGTLSSKLDRGKLAWQPAK